MKRRQLLIFGVLLLILILIVGALMSGSKGNGMMQGAGGKKNDFKYLKVAVVDNDTVDVRISAFGRVTSSRNVSLTAEVQGKLEEGSLPLKVGQNFKQGVYLFGINDTEQRLSLQSRKSQFLNLMASVLPDLKIDYPDNFKQWEDFFNRLDVLKNIPELPVTSSVNEKTFLASRNVLSEYYGIKADEERLKKYKVYAPFTGGYTDVMVEVGTVVNAGTQIARIIQFNSLEVKIPVSVDELQLIRLGTLADVYSENRNDHWLGRIERISSNVNQNTQSVDVFIKVIGDPSGSLYDGMYVQAVIHCGIIEDASRVSRKALFAKNHVYIVEDSLLKEKLIQIEKIDKESVVVKGLTDGELLVTEPVIGMKAEMKVVPVKE